MKSFKNLKDGLGWCLIAVVSVLCLSFQAPPDSSTQKATTAFVKADTASAGPVLIVGTDTIKIKDTVTIPAVGPIIPSNNIDGIPIPPWLQIVVMILGMSLPAVQAILKVIPTPYSVRIGGWIGKILDGLTFFIKDKSSLGTSATGPLFHV